MISVKLNVSKVDKNFLFKGKNGMMLDLLLIEKPNQYGDDGFVKQSLPKEEFERRKQNNIETPIIGNWKRVQARVSQPQQNPQQGFTAAPTNPQPAQEDDGMQVPF